MFTKQEIEDLRKIKLHDIIVNSTSMANDEIQENVFFWHNGDPCPQPMQLNASVLEPCSYLRGFDYFAVRLAFYTSIFYMLYIIIIFI